MTLEEYNLDEKFRIGRERHEKVEEQVVSACRDVIEERNTVSFNVLGAGTHHHSDYIDVEVVEEESLHKHCDHLWRLEEDLRKLGLVIDSVMESTTSESTNSHFRIWLSYIPELDQGGGLT